MTNTDRPAWRIRIPEHTVPRRSVGGIALDHGPYAITAVDTISYEPTRREALNDVILATHIDAGIPPWKPYLRITRALAEAEAVTVSALTGTKPR